MPYKVLELLSSVKMKQHDVEVVQACHSEFDVLQYMLWVTLLPSTDMFPGFTNVIVCALEIESNKCAQLLGGTRNVAKRSKEAPQIHLQGQCVIRSRYVTMYTAVHACCEHELCCQNHAHLYLKISTAVRHGANIRSEGAVKRFLPL